jgi:hypothetical protein
MLASVAYSLRFEGLTRVAVIGVGVALALGTVGLLRLSRRRTNLTMTDGELIFTGLVRRRLLSPVRAISADVQWSKVSSRRSRLWVLVDVTGRAVLGLNRDAWDERQLEGLRESLGLPMETVSRPNRPSELRRATPGFVPWWSAHISLVTVVAIICVAAVVLVVQRLA